MRTLRALFFAFTTLFVGTCLAQGETKVANSKLHDTVADPSHWDKDPHSGLWLHERSAVGGQLKLEMGIVDDEIHFTIRLPCEEGPSETYSWKHGNKIATGTDCDGRLQAKKNIMPFKGWIDPLPREVQEVIEAKKRRLAKTQKLK